MTTYIKNSHYDEKCITYTNSKDATEHLNYENCNAYNNLLHTDEHFANLTIELRETMLHNKDYNAQFDLIKDYVISKGYTGQHLGTFNIK